MIKLEKNQTGIASEFYVAGELSRLGYNVSVTFGNTKSIDLLVEKNGKTKAVQVKGIQTTKSICWNLDKTKVLENVFYILVNLHVNKTDDKPEFFILSHTECLDLFKDTPKEKNKRTYLDYKSLKKLSGFENAWYKLETEKEIGIVEKDHTVN